MRDAFILNTNAHQMIRWARFMMAMMDTYNESNKIRIIIIAIIPIIIIMIIIINITIMNAIITGVALLCWEN